MLLIDVRPVVGLEIFHVQPACGTEHALKGGKNLTSIFFVSVRSSRKMHADFLYGTFQALT